MKHVAYSKEALRALRQHRNMAERIRVKVQDYAREGRSNMVTKLVGLEVYRLRVGDFRIVFAEDALTITVLTIAPRGSAYD